MRSLWLFMVCLWCSKGLQAQVPVHEEPRHRPVFQNDKMRILNVLLPPGDTTQYHVHSTPSLFVFFTSTTTGSQLQGHEPSTGRSTAGTFLFENLAPPHVRVHRVWSLDTGIFHVMDIELLSKDSGFREKPLTLRHLQLAVDTPWVRAYRLELQKEDSFVLNRNNRPLVLIAMTAAQVQFKKDKITQLETVQPGTFFPIAPEQRWLLKSKSNAAARFVLLEVP